MAPPKERKYYRFKTVQRIISRGNIPKAYRFFLYNIDIGICRAGPRRSAEKNACVGSSCFEVKESMLWPVLVIAQPFSKRNLLYKEATKEPLFYWIVKVGSAGIVLECKFVS